MCYGRLLLSATVFERHAKFPIANLSRVDPAFVSTGLHGKKHFHRVGNDQPLLFLSVVKVDQCYLADGRTTSIGKLQKIVRGTLLEGEFERFVGAIGMVIREQDFKAQLYKDVLDFSTFMAFDEKSMFFYCGLICVVKILTLPSAPSSSSTPVKNGKGSTSGQPSPFTFRPSATSTSTGGTSAFKVCLSSTDIGVCVLFFLDILQF
jgi:hypothetical protein